MVNLRLALMNYRRDAYMKSVACKEAAAYRRRGGYKGECGQKCGRCLHARERRARVGIQQGHTGEKVAAL